MIATYRSTSPTVGLNNTSFAQRQWTAATVAEVLQDEQANLSSTDPIKVTYWEGLNVAMEAIGQGISLHSIEEALEFMDLAFAAKK